MADTRAMAAAYEEALKAGDFERMNQLTQEYAADDFVQEWPQSGERLTKEASMRLGEKYEGLSGTSPKFTYKRMLGAATSSSSRGTIDLRRWHPGELRRHRRAPRREVSRR
jgi:hypothetical protein